MLLNVNVTAEALAETSRAEAKFNAPALQRQIQELLYRHGILHFPSKADALEVLDYLKSEELTAAEATHWKKLLAALQKQGRLTAADPAVLEKTSATESASDLEPLEHLAPLVSLVGTPLYERLFPAAISGTTRTSAGVEVATPGSVSEVRDYQRLRLLAETGNYPAGTTRERVWEELLAPLAKVSREVVIFDTYLFVQLSYWAEAADRRAGGAALPEDEHLRWLLTRLDAEALPGTTVKLIGARGIPGDFRGDRVPGSAAALRHLVEENLPNSFSRLGPVEAWFAPSTRARDIHHDRHIRFSAGAGVEVAAGFDRFAYPKLRENTGFTYRYQTASLDELHRREDAVQNNRDSYLFELA